jgi:MraZ protein
VFFLGEYEHSLDPKQRLAIPAELREQFRSDVHGDAWIAAPGANGSLWLWPEKTFYQLAAALNGTLLGHEDVQRLGRQFFSKAARVTVDAAGRVRIPDRLLAQYGLAGSVMILGVGDHLEVCRPEEWKAEQAKMADEQAELWRRARAALGGMTGNGRAAP